MPAIVPKVTRGSASGTRFPFGTTTVRCTAIDHAENVSTKSFDVTVRDTTPPAIAKLTPTIGAVKRDVFPVSIAVSVTDVGDAAPACKISSVTSNAPAKKKDDDDKKPAWTIAGPLAVTLRATDEGEGRQVVYTIGVTCTDKAGNASTASTTVGVPRENERDDDKNKDKNDKNDKNDKKKGGR